MLYFVSNSHFLAISTNLLFLRKRKIEKVSAKNKDENTNTLHLYRYLCNTFSKGLVFVCSKLISGKQKYNI